MDAQITHRNSLRDAVLIALGSFVVSWIIVTGALPASATVGEDWSERDSVFGNARAVVWADEPGPSHGIFVSVGEAGTANYSYDGIEWQIGANAPSGGWWDVAYGDGRFVAVNRDGLGGTEVMTSEDGLSWTGRASALSTGNWSTVEYGDGRFVAVAVGSRTVAYSTDGITWTQATNRLPASDEWQGLTYGAADDRWVAVSQDGPMAWVDGDDLTTTNWTSTTGQPTWDWENIAYGNGRFVAVSEGFSVGLTTSSAAYSDDGKTWTQSSSTPSPTTDAWYGVTYANSMYVAVGWEGNRVMTSLDGDTWTARTAPSGVWTG